MMLLLSLAGICLFSGVKAGNLQDGIIGGHEAIAHSRPYMAYIENNGKLLCGGFLVRKDFVMTAAHCNRRDMIITLGAHDISVNEKSQQLVRVLQAFQHPEYNSTPFANDIMLLKLKSNVKLNSYVTTIPLPSASSTVEEGDICSVAGWGISRPNSNTTEHKLKEVNLEVVPVDECREISPKIVEESVICAGNPSEKKASFNGDSGGPLVCQKVPQGIVSYGQRNGDPPRIFTKISKFMPWINKTMSQYD